MNKQSRWWEGTSAGELPESCSESWTLPWGLPSMPQCKEGVSGRPHQDASPTHKHPSPQVADGDPGPCDLASTHKHPSHSCSPCAPLTAIHEDSLALTILSPCLSNHATPLG